jgi:nucleoside-diphosphate-sugar epimerase
VRDPAALDAAVLDIDHVVHLAAIVGEAACDRSPDVTRAINFGGTQNVARAARQSGVERLIFFSTCSSYGVQDTTQLADEQTQLNPVSLYAETKIDAERFLLDTADGEMVHTIFRPATVHGPSARMRFDLIVNHFVRDAFATGKLTIYAPDMWRPLIWVGDPAKAIELALGAEESLVRDQVFNLGATDGNYRKGEIGEIIKNKFLPSLELGFTGSDRDTRSYRVDFSKIKERLGFQPSKTLEEAIGDVYQTLKSAIIADPFAPEYRND